MPVDKNAEQRLRQALEANPEDATLHNDLGNELLALGQTAEALESYETALRLMPDRAEIHFNLANALVAAGRSDDALESFQRAVQLDPDGAATHNNLGNLLRTLRRPAEALESYRRAMHLQPRDASIRYNIGTALIDLYRIEEALVWFEQAARAQPPYAPAACAGGEALVRLGRIPEALQWFDLAKRLRPGDPNPRLGEGLAMLMLGHFREGWAGFEARVEDRRVREGFPAVTGPIWRGKEDINGRTMLIYAEQGFGDIIQFVRYVPLLRARGARVVLRVPAPVLSLLRPLPDRIIDSNGRVPKHDLHCPLLSLPLAFDTRLATIPAEVPYLSADREHLTMWKQRLGPKRCRRIGLALSGNPQHEFDRLRSIPAVDFASVLHQAGVEFHLLQKLVPEADLPVLREAGVQIHSQALRGFSDTAALIAHMDLVISVDSSPAHLAGAMAKPVWIMLQFDCDFRWMRGRTDSPWYPTARLFRQPAMREWRPVIEAVAEAVAAER